MKILKNFDAKKIANAKNKILLAIVSILFLVLLFSSSAFREFVSKHPGLIGVLIAVSGEVYFDWKEESGRHAKWKKFFMALLVVSLAYELYEASESDQKAADSIKLAGQANERAANTESNNLVLQTNVAALNGAVIQLAHEYDLSTNALAEANSRLASVKTLKERLLEWFNDFDPSIIPALKSGQTKFLLKNLPEYRFNQLASLLSEHGSAVFCSSTTRDPTVYITGGIGQTENLIIVLKPELTQ